jgi:FKBP-type peptidyl-prolyl cis-trans isomerase 2
MTLKKGDFLLIDYTANVKETGEVFDTTFEDVSKKEHLHKEGEICEPKLVVLGEGWMLKALDDSLATMEIGRAHKVEIAPKDAFGQRDPEKLRRVPLKQLMAKGTTPIVGMRLDYNGKMATVRSIGAGRVLLDFNPPLAGKTLIYNVNVNKKLETSEEKISALIHRRIPLADESKFKFNIQDKTLAVDMPEETFYIEGIQIAKRGVAMDIQRFLPELAEIKFVETFKSEPRTEVKQEVKPEVKSEQKTVVSPTTKPET